MHEVIIIPEVDHVIIHPAEEMGPAGPQGPQGEIGPPGAEDVVARDAIVTHVMDPTPHAAYDDAHSFRLLFENHLV